MQWVTLIRMRQVSSSYLDLHTVYNPHTNAKTVPKITLKPSPHAHSNSLFIFILLPTFNCNGKGKAIP
jgi:hypothetical protein